MSKAYNIEYVDINGDIQSVSASFYPANNDDDKGKIKLHPKPNKATSVVKAFKVRLQQLIYQARLHEYGYQHHCRVHFSFSNEIPADDNWHLAAICADRLARGQWARAIIPEGAQAQLFNPSTGELAMPEQQPQGTYGHWLVVDKLAEAANHSGINNLSELNTQAHTPPRTGEAWFPLDSDQPDILQLRVTTSPLTPNNPSATVVFNAKAGSKIGDEISQTLQQARNFDPRSENWLTLVELPEAKPQTDGSSQYFTGNSYQLALVLADRIARGRDIAPPQGKLIASGQSSQWQEGIIEAVGGLDTKLRYLEALLTPQDRLIIPDMLLATDAQDQQTLGSGNGEKRFATLHKQCQFSRLGKLPIWTKSTKDKP